MPDSGPEDPHFILDKLDGTITLGPSLLQPDGFVYRFGCVPEKGSLLRFSRYQYGGGVVGNVSQGTLCVLKSSIPYVKSGHKSSASGGRTRRAKPGGCQTARPTEAAHPYTCCDGRRLRIPGMPGAGVARACCLAPGAQPGAPNDPRPGQVFVVVLPQTDAPQEHIPPERLVLSAELHDSVSSQLEARRLVGTALEVRQPQYVWVSVQAELRVPERSDPALIREVQQRAEEALYRYLNPYVGGPRGDGWPFGRALNRSEIYGLLQRIKGVEFVEDVQMSISKSSGGINPQPPTLAERMVPIPRYGLICSDQHQVKVS